ncbi:MAG: YIP1 family protein [Ignavibacteria bacterium]|nr:YIP1 family protein [Ignavibacteria bacterium]
MSMLDCPVCHYQNHHLAINCSSCGSFLQARVENLDLFATAWNILERPRKTFHTIAIAKHKNYVVPLSMLSGVAIIYSIFWITKAGDHAESLLNILTASVAVGPPLGIFTLFTLGVLIASLGKIVRSKVRLRDAFAIAVYALIPIDLSIFLILPIKLLSFGQYYFTSNPSPYLLKPNIYVVLLILDGTFTLWSMVLLFLGIQKLLDRAWITILAIGLGACGILVGMIVTVLRLLFPSLA